MANHEEYPEVLCHPMLCGLWHVVLYYCANEDKKVIYIQKDWYSEKNNMQQVFLSLYAM